MPVKPAKNSGSKSATKPKPTAPSRPKGQKSIDTFFGGRKKVALASEPDEDKDEDEEDGGEDEPKEVVKDDDYDEQDEEDDDAPGESSADTSLDSLPPIVKIPEIFADIVKRVPKLKRVAEHVKGRKIRVATMCSGTESPLLALDLIQKSIHDRHHVKLEIEHVFSCEIEPFKQAYIERNFRPPLLFRDVCELGQTHATTAYGAEAPVPGDVDLLVAGTSCVDYSNLNNEKQGIDAGGESGRTFHGMLDWVANHRPPLVILENVCGAPWPRVVQKFETLGYSAAFVKLDTKQYYIPHTRQRVYLLAVNQENSNIPEDWAERVKELKRPATSTLDEFLLPSDDSRIHHFREKLVQEGSSILDRRSGRTDWGRCESRHQRARLEEGLGSKRPLTNWEEGGFCSMPEEYWHDWARNQVERVWDLLDISLLRAAAQGYDPAYKTQIWNLSQNVDREIGAKRMGICPCLTPSMIPYITNRGGPMVGLEALAMQGLPTDELILSKEKEDQLADLAGNAMSTTVVGTAIIAALVEGLELIRSGDDHESYEAKDARTDAADAAMDSMDVDIPQVDSLPVEDHIVGDDRLIEKPLGLTIENDMSIQDVLLQAQRSIRLCRCEGRDGMTERDIKRCQSCNSTSCVKCAGRPEHDFQALDLTKESRLSPLAFSKAFKSVLPMSLSINGITEELLDNLKDESEGSVDAKLWAGWRASVLRAVSEDYRFVELKRREIWSAIYESPSARVELLLSPHQPQWQLFAKPDVSLPAKSPIRTLLESPIARLICRDTWLSGRWDIALPLKTTVPIEITGTGPQVPAWEQLLGLQAPQFKNKTVYEQVRISVPLEHSGKFDRDISGDYDLLARCGTASNGLHRRRAKDGEDANIPPLFLLLDPTRTGHWDDDCFVFSISNRRYEFGEARPIVARLDNKWRQSSVKDAASTVKCTIPCVWKSTANVRLQASVVENARYAAPSQVLDVSSSAEACQSACAVLVCRVPLKGQAGPEWPRGMYQEVDKVHERTIFRSIAWLLERIRSMGDHFSQWQPCDLPPETCVCERCAPSQPSLRWVKVKQKVVATEDPVQAGEHERRLKHRPSPFVTQLKLDESETGIVRIGVNVLSLIHRAMSRLPTAGRTETPTVSWRIDTNFVPAVKLNVPKFVLSSNKHDIPHDQPGFKVPLRPEQLRSLAWMLRQEAVDCQPFVEEEISESVLEALGWRAEGRVQRPTRVRGGVLADEVGYGKTAITLGLIDSARECVEEEFDTMPDIKGKIPVKATLVIVPPHLTRQWKSEVDKFIKRKMNVVVISTAGNINALTIKAVMKADIVIVASNLFHSNVYLANLEAFAGVGDLPNQDGRYFEARLADINAALAKQVDLLVDEGSSAVMREIQAGRKRVDEAAAAALAPTKRLVGKAYREKAKPIPDPVSKNKQNGHPTPRETLKRGPTSGKIMEVVIPKRRISYFQSSDGPPTSVPPSPSEDDDESSEHRPSRRRAATRKAPIVISEDEADDGSDFEVEQIERSEPESEPVVRPSKPSARKRKAKPVSDSSDYEVSGVETSSESEAGEDSDSDVVIVSKPSGKAKMVAKSKQNAKTTRSEPSSDDNVESDSDVPATKKTSGSSKKNVKKRKSVDGGKEEPPPKKQKRRVDSDPWKLGSKDVKEDWRRMQAPPLEMFHFARKVVDEYTYLQGKSHSLITKLTADRLWVLSGTPPVHDFAAVKTIAAFLNIHLGVDDDGEGQSAQVKKRRRDQTAAEKFHSFREVHTVEWHANRHQLAQMFLNQFVRQNIAEIDEIPFSVQKEKIILPAAERAIYLELEHHLRALDMTIKRGKKNESDREKRLAQSMGESSSAEEALLKRCSHFELETNYKDNAPKACDIIVKERTKQLEDCKADLLKHLQDALKMEAKIGRTSEESSFREWVRVCQTEGVGDADATETILQLLEEAGVSRASKAGSNRLGDANSTKAKAAKGKGGKPDDGLSKEAKDRIWTLREHTHNIRRLAKELVGRERSLRYFKVVRELQKKIVPLDECPRCHRTGIPMSEVGVLSTCGHMGCLNCVTDCADREECVASVSAKCRVPVRRLNIVKGDTLGVDDVRDGQGKHYGKKIEQILDLLRNRIPKDERVLIFVQFPDLMKKVAEALAANKVKFLEIKGTAIQKSKNLELFQNNGPERVLLLNVMDESASGANLTGANHAIFISPLLADSQEQYDACETQAIGRLRRYGQTQHVHIYRFLTADTIDMEIYEQRSHRPKGSKSNH